MKRMTALAPVDNSLVINLLDWLRDNESVYPATAAVAQRFLSVPATLVPVQWERLFLAVRRLIMKPRSRFLLVQIESRSSPGICLSIFETRGMRFPSSWHLWITKLDFILVVSSNCVSILYSLWDKLYLY